MSEKEQCSKPEHLINLYNIKPKNLSHSNNICKPPTNGISKIYLHKLNVAHLRSTIISHYPPMNKKIN